MYTPTAVNYLISILGLNNFYHIVFHNNFNNVTILNNKLAHVTQFRLFQHNYATVYPCVTTAVCDSICRVQVYK